MDLEQVLMAFKNNSKANVAQGDKEDNPSVIYLKSSRRCLVDKGREDKEALHKHKRDRMSC